MATPVQDLIFGTSVDLYSIIEWRDLGSVAHQNAHQTRGAQI